MDNVRDSFGRGGLVRPRDGRVLGGVCAGLGRRLGLDPWPTRLLFILVVFLLPGSSILVYPILWILMPQEGDTRYVSTATPSPAGPAHS